MEEIKFNVTVKNADGTSNITVINIDENNNVTATLPENE